MRAGACLVDVVVHAQVLLDDLAGLFRGLVENLVDADFERLRDRASGLTFQLAASRLREWVCVSALASARHPTLAMMAATSFFAVFRIVSMSANERFSAIMSAIPTLKPV
jgi:hypothetical protein